MSGLGIDTLDTPCQTNVIGDRPVRIAFRLSSMGFGGAERVFLSVADALSRVHPVEIHFVVDRLGQGETESIARQHGFTLFGLDCARTVRSIIPLRNYIDAQRPDILISAYTDTNMAALLSAKLARHRCPVVVTEHASLDEHWQYASWKRRLALNTYVRFGYRLADHVLGVSRGIAKQVRQRLNRPDMVSCIHNPVRFSVSDDESAGASQATRSTSATILAVGRITRQKDYLTLLRAFKIVSATRDARLVIVGGVHEAAEKTQLDAFISANGLAGKIDFAGYTEHVEAFYRSSDLFVLSSAWEGFGNVLVEALAFGLPVVSTNCRHGPAEILCDGRFGTLVPVGDATALAAAMVSSLNTQPDREALRRRSRDFTEERVGAQYWGLIEHLMSRQ